MTGNQGWFPQPDGRERYYDGEQWTDHYRAPSGQGAPAPQAPGGPPPKRKSSPWKWIIIIGVIVLMVCFGGFAACTAGVLGTANEVNESMESAESESGGPNNPVEITEGEAFEVRGFAYSDGWKVTEELGSVSIEDLKVTNNRESRDSALVTIKFMKGSEVMASVDCTSDPIQPGQTVTLNCLSADEMPTDYDKITINDTF